MAVWLVLFALPQAVPGAQPGEAATVVSIRGYAEFRRMPSSHWDPASAEPQPTQLDRGDAFRVGTKSRADLRWKDGLVTSHASEASFVIPTSGVMARLLAGLHHFVRRDRPEAMMIEAGNGFARAVARNTEFVVEVTGDRAQVSVLEGQVELGNAAGGTLQLAAGQGGRAFADGTLEGPFAISTVRVVQWVLYYPAVLWPEDLGLTPEAEPELAASLNAWNEGDPVSAARLYPEGRIPGSRSESTYLAGLWLAVGQVERSEEELDRGWGTVGAEPSTPDLGSSLRQVIATVRTQHFDRVEAPRRASEWLAESYRQQARDPGGQEGLSAWEGAVYGPGDHADQPLRNALVAAAWATTNAPGSGYAWRRRAELEFSFGRSDRASEFVDRALTLSPRLAPAWALKGFLAAARDRMSEATNHFARAIALDGSLGEARLGMGLSLYRLGETEDGLRQLRLAAAVEPRRSLFRSYLGKAFFEAASGLMNPLSPRRDATVLGLSATGLVRYAEVDLGRAREFDAEDPTPELYAALMHYRQNRVNAAIRELEASEEASAHRRVYRSGFLLDQDRAVRSANLAAIYRDAGMAEVGLLEASSAAEYDYGNYSAHLFLAGSYDTLRDPRRVNVRYDAAWNNELLLADLLAPVGAGALSQSVSQQEFSRLFDKNRQFGVYSSTEYASSGDWTQAASAYGVEGRLAYAVDGAYRRLTGTRSNQDLEGRDVRVKLKGRLTERDTVLFQLGYGHVEAGDGLMHYDPAMADPDFRIEERLEPEVLLGWHREWSPGMHTLLMSGLLRNRLESRNLGLVGDAYGLPDDPYGLTLIVPDAVRWDQHYEGELDSRFVEWQQIWQTDTHNLVVGTRYQGGRIDARNQVLNPAEIVDGYPLGLTADPESMSTDSGDADFWRWSLYAYHRQRLMESLWLTAGVGYDTTEVPENQANPPLSDREIRESLVSPKAGLTWRPADRTTVRGAFSRSLTGLSLEQDYRLEPSQVAGVLQSFRGLFPEALVATPAAATLATGGVSVQQQFAGSTYLTVSGEVRSSSADDTVGTYTYDDNSPYRRLVPVQMPRALEYSEGAVEVSLVHLTRERWSFGVRYRLAKAEMEMEVDQRGLRIEDSIVTKGDSILHTLGLSARYQDPAGLFAVVDTGYWHQPDYGRGEEHPLGPLWVEPPADSQESLWQVGARIGYRFPLRRGEVSAGVLNLFDADYRLNPLNYHPELPRERTWVFRLAIQF